MELTLKREAHFAGSFYPEEPALLEGLIKKFLAQATVKKIKKTPKALIAPHAGYLYSGPVAGYAYKLIKELDFKKIILLGPSHHFPFKGLISGGFKIWQTPLGPVESFTLNDFPALKDKALISEASKIHEPEHCLEVQIPFLQMTLHDFKIFPLLSGQNEIKEIKDMAILLNKIMDEKTLLIVSSDLSHYYPYDEAQRLDKVTLDAILANDLLRFDKFGEACGKTAIEILMALAQINHWQSTLLSYLNSGDTSGEKSQVVGYASLVFS